jgi:hypothetical protein
MLYAIPPYVALELCGTIVNCLPLAYKRRRRSRGRGGTTNSCALARFLPSSRYWHFASIKPQGPGGFASSPAMLVAPLCKHHGATQYSASSATLLDIRPTAGTRIKPVPLCCLAPAIERQISVLILVSVGTTFCTDTLPCTRYTLRETDGSSRVPRAGGDRIPGGGPTAWLGLGSIPFRPQQAPLLRLPPIPFRPRHPVLVSLALLALMGVAVLGGRWAPTGREHGNGSRDRAPREQQPLFTGAFFKTPGFPFRDCEKRKSTCRDWACSPMVGQSSGMLPTRVKPSARTFSWIFQDLPALCVKW